MMVQGVIPEKNRNAIVTPALPGDRGDPGIQGGASSALARRVVLHRSTHQVKIPGTRNPVVHQKVAWCPCRTEQSCLTIIKEISICVAGFLAGREEYLLPPPGSPETPRRK